jgi:uncharacterized membrane protein YhaH (DUF805 family)
MIRNKGEKSMEWATLPLKRYADFTGRSRRKEYWMFTLLCVVVAIVLSVIEGILGLSGVIGYYGPLTLLFLLGILVPSIAVGIRRLHDTDRSGWWILISFVPFVGGLILLVFYVLEGTKGPNQYGADPKGADLESTFA